MSLSDRKIRSSGYSALRLAKGEELLAMGLMRLRRRRERERGPKHTKRGTEGPEEGSRDRSGRKEGSRRGGEIQSRPGNLIREDQQFLEKPSFNNWELRGGVLASGPPIIRDRLRHFGITKNRQGEPLM